MAHYTHNRDHEKPLTRKDVAALAWAVSFTAACIPPTTRTGGTTLHIKLRNARAAMKKVRELKGQGL